MRFIAPAKLFGYVHKPIVHPNHARMSAMWKATLPPPPDVFDVDISIGIVFPPRMYLNNSEGDCVIAARANQSTRFYAQQTGRLLTISDGEVQDEYLVETGGADTGLVPDESLTAWKTNGWVAAGAHHAIQAWGRVDVTCQLETQRCISLLGGMQLSMMLPLAWQGLINNGQPWDAPPAGTSDSSWLLGSWGGHQCLTGDTKISLMDGTEKSLRYLARNHAADKFWVYSCTPDGKIVPGLAFAPRRIGKRNIIEITLDNGEKIRCTSDHRFMRRGGKYREAGKLKIGQSLMPLYRRIREDKAYPGYEEFYNPADKKWYLTHRMSAQSKFGFYEGVAHHKDHNKRNNVPCNFQVMTWDEHTKHHAKHPVGSGLNDYAKSQTGREKSRELMKKLWADPVWRAKTLKKLDEGRKLANTPEAKAKHSATFKRRWNTEPEFRRAWRESHRRSRFSRKQANNHKVVSVRDCGFEWVYDLSVEKYHNFALSAGVFVHNCWCCGYDHLGIYVWTWGQKQLITWNGLAWIGAESNMGEAEGVVRCNDAIAGASPADNLDIDRLMSELSVVEEAQP